VGVAGADNTLVVSDEDGNVWAMNGKTGVIAPLVGMIGSLQALETIKLLLNIGQCLQGQLIRWDGLTGTFQ
jgi:molybdopterin/thiamine biosynthesis adenylyltransferase